MSERVKLAADYAARNSQEHLDAYLKPYHSSESDALAKDILSLDLKKINEIYKGVTNISDSANSELKLEPLEVMDSQEIFTDKREELTEMGLQFIKEGKFAAITLAGGYGTRLGHDGPKGTFMLPLKEPKSLFQIQCEGLKVVCSKAGRQVPWLIMTSKDNHDATVRFFKENSFFGYDSELIRFFPQNEIAAVDNEGKLLVRSNVIVRAADGNGGIFAALASSGHLKSLIDSGIKKVFICGIDNALINMADPLFLGYSIEADKPIACKSVLKRSYDEKAGVFCRNNGKPYYIEYTEIPVEQAKLTDAKGRFVFGDAGIVAYVYDMSLLKELADRPLPYHAANKKVAYSLPNGKLIEPTVPNAVKFESFIFDSFKYAQDIAVMRVDRSKEFAPIKNRTGEDSPESFIQMTLL